MRVLLDTNAVLFAIEANRRLSGLARETIIDPRNTRLMSPVTPWELAIKLSAGKWHPTRGFTATLEEQDRALRLDDLPITRAHIVRLAELPLIHRDPFDRMLIAQALVEGLPIVTSDRRFASYGVDVIW